MTLNKRVVAILLTLGLIGVLFIGTSSAMPSRPTEAKLPAEPNIVYIQTDDLSKNLLPYMSAVREMKKNGTTFSNAFVTDGLCCPSRASILTGKYPHNTRVLVNEGNRDDFPGGYQAFRKHQDRTYATALDKEGYRTGYLGKYLNGYKIRKDSHKVPPAWDEWHVSTDGYSNMAKTYSITKVKSKQQRGKDISSPNAYMNDVLGKRARGFVNRADDRGQPFFLQLSSFAPHQRVGGKGTLFPAAKKDRPGGQYAHGDCGTKPDGSRFDCAKLHVKRVGGFDEDTYRKLDKNFRDRVRMMQSLNDQIKELRKQLARNGQLHNTIFVFGSDNGYHLGEHGLKLGKGSAYDHDAQVPLIVEGPGVPRGKVRNEIVQLVDLYPTFQQLANLNPKASNGHGLRNLLLGSSHANWRDAALIEHKPQQRKGSRAADPDLDGDVGSSARGGFVPAFHEYNAIRTKDWLYVKYLDSKRRELYNLKKRPGQYHNVADDRPGKVRDFNKWLRKYTDCGRQGDKTCWKAGQG